MTDESEKKKPVKKVIVDAAALSELLRAVTGPGHLIRELQMLRGSPVEKITGIDTPITVLLNQFNEQYTHGFTELTTAHESDAKEIVVGTAVQIAPGEKVWFIPTTMIPLNNKNLVLRKK